jgi:hypothetical protein
VAPQTLFSLANGAAILGWLALAVAPLGRPRALAIARLVAVGLALTYTALLIGSLNAEMFESDFATLEGLTAAFARPEAMVVGWVHYLAFDLWVGAWAAEDAHARGLPHWALLPCLFFILMTGPFGLILYLAARSVSGRFKSSPKAG